VVSTGAIRLAELVENVTIDKPTSSFFTGWMSFLSPAKLSARCNSDGDQGKLSSGQTSFLYDEKFPLSINQNFKLKKILGDKLPMLHFKSINI